MEIKAVIDALLDIKQQYPNLTNDEVLKIMEIKVRMEGNSR